MKKKNSLLSHACALDLWRCTGEHGGWQRHVEYPVALSIPFAFSNHFINRIVIRVCIVWPFDVAIQLPELVEFRFIAGSPLDERLHAFA